LYKILKEIMMFIDSIDSQTFFHKDLTMKIFIASLSFLFLVGCSTSSNFTYDPEIHTGSKVKISNITTENLTGQTYDDIDVNAEMTSAVERALRERNITSSDSANLNIRIIQYKKGNAVARWMMPGVGITVLSVEAVLTDPEGKEIGWGQVTRSIGAGGLYTIGAYKTIFNEVADALVKELDG
jgi:hypothetical protein